MRNEKKYIAVAAGLLVTVMLAWFFLGPSGRVPPTSGKPLALQGTLEGFKPGAKVSYSILPEEGKPASGESRVDASGRIDLPAYNLYDAAGRYLSYTIEVEEKDKEKPLNVAMTLDSKDGSIAVQGKGLDPSSQVMLGGQATNADWAGMIREAIAGHLNDLGEEGFKVALYGGVASDAAQPDPRIIKVLAAPGGGLYIDPLLNTYFFPYGCDDTLVPPVMYSFCFPGSITMKTTQIVDNYVRALMMMTEQLTAVMGSMMLHVGAMIDAKFQLETQREWQRLTAQAHKDYHPSEMMCEFGSFMRNLSSSDDKANTEKEAISTILMDTYIGKQHTVSSESIQSDFDSRADLYRRVFCDVRDNNDGLRFMCDHDQDWATPAAGGNDQWRANMDIDYFRAVDERLTMDIDFTYSHALTSPARPTEEQRDELNILALGRNLYWAQPLPPVVPERLKDQFFYHQDARHIYAAMGVAHSAYAAILGMKSKEHPTLFAQGSYVYMQAMMRNFGMSDAQTQEYLGPYSSYYAQMEVLTKKIYQQPDFYTNLYDKPANVKRIGATLDAISLMQMRDMYDSLQRREVMNSLLLEEALQPHVKKLNAAVVEDMQNFQRR